MKSEAFPPQFKIKNLKFKIRSKPLIAVTMGDPAGIGAEVALKALASSLKRSRSNYLLLGDYHHLVRCAQKFKIRIPLVWVNEAGLARQLKGQVGVLDLGGVSKILWGKISASNGKAAVRYVTEGARLALDGEVDALVTAPINKEAIHKAGCPFPGHTELLAHLSQTKSFAMMMVGGPFKIVLQSIHLSLKESITKVKPGLVWEKLEMTHRTLRDWFGIPNPRIAVAGVNPHAGENGAFGKEEIKVLKPVVLKAQGRGWKVSGPHPPDTLFYWASKGKFDAVLCMYHDQGLIPLKLAAFDSGVNMTLGLPFVRTSPDHGTAFDIAGKGKANPQSMVSALQLAERLSKQKLHPLAG
jgi:4-phospho-D-threonate 3-dehydrogenase / 4-phospho-D-erythronate 3-dehydrogenase